MLDFQFQAYAKKINVESGDSLYADVINHCPKYKEYLVGSDKISSAHEVTHCINSDVRNAAGGNVNAFYHMRDRAIVLPEPKCRKSDAVEFIPQSLRFSRYSTYVSGQSEWDGQPLYLWDEWTAYLNGAITGIDLDARKELSRDEYGSDWVFAPLEFVTYGVAVLMAADKHDHLDDLIIKFSRFILRRSFNTYFNGKTVFPWQGLDDLYTKLKSGSEAASLRSFMQQKLNYVVQDKALPEDGGDDPQPLPLDLIG